VYIRWRLLFTTFYWSINTKFYQNELAVKNTADVTGGKPIAILLQSISGVSAINPLVAFYDIHGGKREALFFYFVPDTTRDIKRGCLRGISEISLLPLRG
jgi:hypothetical protein